MFRKNKIKINSQSSVTFRRITETVRSTGNSIYNDTLRPLSGLSLVVLLLTIFTLPEIANADIVTIGEKGCDQSRSTSYKGTKSFTIRNQSRAAKYYDIIVGPHAHRNLRIAANRSAPFTLRGIPDGDHSVYVLGGTIDRKTLLASDVEYYRCSGVLGVTFSGPSACDSNGNRSVVVELQNPLVSEFYQVQVSIDSESSDLVHASGLTGGGVRSTLTIPLDGIPAVNRTFHVSLYGLNISRRYKGQDMWFARCNR